MKKILKTKIFGSGTELVNFINENSIAKEDIQTINTFAIGNQMANLLYYWDFSPVSENDS